MYAIIRAGGKQYKVQAGDTVRVELLQKNLGDTFDLPEVLMVGGDKNFIGSPLVQNAKVTVIVTQQGKASKILVFKKKRRQGYRRMQGHRQLFTELFVKSITSPEGQTTNTEKTAVVVDPVKNQARKDAFKAEQKAARTTGKPVAKKVAAAPKKKVTKKKSAAKKKSAGKKTTGKSAKKKAAKKTSSKKD
jgi:large subunit ribosomal protein L21